ncbi:hypothetical protein [Leptospira noguchii]|uniref:hypothetical protein n=1 Tax=Leptospira noguchii TaxID=28182 RepID=UPI000A780E2D|nr:hypothetical protein [Leptospira noguchii]
MQPDFIFIRNSSSRLDQCSNRNRYKRYCRKKAIYGTLAVFPELQCIRIVENSIVKLLHIHFNGTKQMEIHFSTTLLKYFLREWTYYLHTSMDLSPSGAKSKFLKDLVLILKFDFQMKPF